MITSCARWVITKSRRCEFGVFLIALSRWLGSIVSQILFGDGSFSTQRINNTSNLYGVHTRFRHSDSCCQLDTQRTHGAIITSLLSQNDNATSFWRNNDVIFASCVRWDTHGINHTRPYLDVYGYYVISSLGIDYNSLWYTLCIWKHAYFMAQYF